MRRRVVVTGMGVVSAAGTGYEAFKTSVIEGRSCLVRITHEKLIHFATRYAGLVNDTSFPAFVNNDDLLHYDRYVLLALIAAKEALEKSRVDPARLGRRIGLICGTCSGPMLTIEKYYERAADTSRGISEHDDPGMQYYSATRILAKTFGILGPSATVTTACSASTAAAGIAADLIRAGACDAVLAGGADSFSVSTFAGFAALKALSEGLCAPFSKPVGLNLGEGAGFMVFEHIDSAKERGADIYGEFLGYGLSNDAYHSSAPDPSGRGALLAMEKAFHDAGVGSADISYVNSHGTGTEANDKAETKAIRRIFGARASAIPVSSTKSMIGHCLGAAGAIETIACLACGSGKVLPPTANYNGAREGCPVDAVPDSGRRWEGGSIFVKNNFAFGGNNASAVYSFEELREYRNSGIPDVLRNDPVCITGYGILTRAGIGVPLPAGSSLSADTLRIPEINLRGIDKRIDSRSDRLSRFVCASVSMTLSSASIPERSLSRAETGFYLGLLSGSTWAESEHITALLRDNYAVHQVASFPYIVPNSIPGSVCRTFSLTGHNTVFCDGPGCGLLTVCHSVTALEIGHCRQIITGAVDNVPQDSRQDGRSEAVVTLVLEHESDAVARGATPVARVIGFAMSSGSDLKDLIIDTLEKNGTEIDRIGAVCCRKNDAYEMQSVRSVFGDRGIHVVDCSGAAGDAQACIGVISLLAAIEEKSIENDGSGKYILALFGSPRGNNCALLVQQQFVSKE